MRDENEQQLDGRVQKMSKNKKEKKMSMSKKYEFTKNVGIVN